MKNAFYVFLAIMVAVFGSVHSYAVDARSAKLNQRTVGLLVSQPQFIGEAMKIANSVDHTDGLRVLPILGRGGLQSLNDLLFLRGVDVTLLSSDSLAFARKNNLYTDEVGRISYLAKIGNKNIVVLAKQEFATLESLAGKRVAVGPTESDEFVVADLVFGSMGLNIEKISLMGSSAVEALQAGHVDAAIFSGIPPDFASLQASDGVHVLPIQLNASLSEIYTPAILTDQDMPTLLAAGKTLETIAAAEVLAVFNWPAKSERYFKLEKFNRALFSTYFSSVKKEGNTNYLAAVPGWKPYVTVKQTSGERRVPTNTLAVN